MTPVELDVAQRAQKAAATLARNDGFFIGVIKTSRFALDDEADHPQANESGIHIDFMIGSNDVDVDGITPDGERVPVLRDGAWQI